MTLIFSFGIRPVSKLALLGKTTHFSTDLSGNFEGISKDMAEKLNDKDVKNELFFQAKRVLKQVY